MRPNILAQQEALFQPNTVLEIYLFHKNFEQHMEILNCCLLKLFSDLCLDFCNNIPVLCCLHMCCCTARGDFIPKCIPVQINQQIC